MKTKLFKGIDSTGLTAMLSCLNAKTVSAAKDEFLLIAGDKPVHIGILLEGSLQIIKETADGERMIIAPLTPGDIFAEALCCADIIESPVSVVSVAESVVMLVEFSRILHTCPNSCDFHQKLISNMLFVLATKNIMIQSRLDLLGKGTLRDKIMSYLESFSIKKGGIISIPLNREELADYLCVDRSALSHELARMKKDGMIFYNKNQFKIL